MANNKEVSPVWSIRSGRSPLVATAIHDGHDLRSQVADVMALAEADRRREEDPHTGIWARLTDTWVVVNRSRFEMDLNRPRQKAVYILPEDAWGLHVWKQTPPEKVIAQSLAQYDAFYEDMEALFFKLQHRWRHFVILDLHSYNHRRAGPEETPADPADNPEVNLGTGTMNRDQWRTVVDRFVEDLRAVDFLGRHLDVRENVKFPGGHFARWTHEKFPEAACVLAVEFKKFFMDEWSGVAYPDQVDALSLAIQSTFPGILEELEELQTKGLG
jgi:hypothetical protein